MIQEGRQHDHDNRDAEDPIRPEAFNRRTLFGLAAAVALAGCASGGEPRIELLPTTTPPPPDETVNDTAPPTTEPAVTDTAPESTDPAVATTAPILDNPFLLGVASGDPLPDAVMLWTRLLEPTSPRRFLSLPRPPSTTSSPR
ncbi:MAG: hypothetical protein R2715_17325 [Ilumatobacteraceae bacterium]